MEWGGKVYVLHSGQHIYRGTRGAWSRVEEILIKPESPRRYKR